MPIKILIASIAIGLGILGYALLLHTALPEQDIPPLEALLTKNQEAPAPPDSPSSTQATLELKFHEPQKYEIASLYQKLKRDCITLASGCFYDALKNITSIYGPQASLEALSLLQQDKLVLLSDDDHQVAHTIGRDTAKDFGANGLAFLLCPTSFNYGCQHGFFEYVLGRTTSTKEAAGLICGTLEKNANYSQKFKFYCYHGLGHGVLWNSHYETRLFPSNEYGNFVLLKYPTSSSVASSIS